MTISEQSTASDQVQAGYPGILLGIWCLFMPEPKREGATPEEIAHQYPSLELADLFHQRKLLLQPLSVAFFHEKDVVHEPPDIVEIALALDRRVEGRGWLRFEPLLPLVALASGVNEQLVNRHGQGHVSNIASAWARQWPTGSPPQKPSS